MGCTHHEIRWKNGNGKVRGSCFYVLLIVLPAAGCGERTGEISGKVFYKGKPLILPGAMVTFVHPTKGNFSASITSEGDYAISNVPTGEVKIAVLSLPARRRANSVQQKRQEAIKSGGIEMSPKEREAKMFAEPAAEGSATAISPSYSDPEKSGLTYTVVGGRQTHDIYLK